MSTDQLAFLADVPDLTGFAWPEGGPEDVGDARPPTSRIQVARLGKFAHPRYGKFTLTRDTYDSFIRNFAAGLPTPELPGDFDHAPETRGDTAACGWIKALHADDDKLWASVEWGWEAAFAIREGRFKYISPTWSLNWVDDEGGKHGPTLLAFALTNRPFFSKLATVSLSQTFSRDTFDGEGEPAEEEAPDSRPRPTMDDFLQKIRTVFSLGEDTTEDQILAAASTALANQIPAEHIAVTASRVAELERASKVPTGHTVVASNVLTDLEGRAAKTDRLEAEVSEIKFDTAFALALSEGRATPAQKETLRAIFIADNKLGLQTLDSLLPQVVTHARGDSGHVPVDTGTAGDGVDGDRHDLDRKVRSYMRANSMTDDQYLDALYAVADQEPVA